MLWLFVILQPAFLGASSHQCVEGKGQLRFMECAGCCRGPVVRREAIIMAAFFSITSFWGFFYGWPRQYR